MNGIKKIPFYILLFFCAFNQTYAQKIEKFYDFRWQECQLNAARFYSLTIKTDSGYYRTDYFIRENRLQMSGNFKDSTCKIENGRFKYFHANGILESTGNYVEGKRDGLWLDFHNNGKMSDSTVFSQGKPVGIHLTWYENGYPFDSTNLKTDGSESYVSWFDNGAPSSAGRYSEGGRQNGKWKYFHKNGKISSIEIYDKSKLIDKQYFDETGMMLNDTTNNDRNVKFPGGVKAWNKYVSNHLYFPTGYKITNADEATIVVTFTVNEDEGVEDVFTSVPFNKAFDEIGEKLIKQSPKWIPAISHNRRVKCNFSQIMKFINYKE